MLLAFAVTLLLGAVLAATVRTGSWAARTGAVLTLLGVALSAFAPPASETVSTPATMALVGTDERALQAIAADARARSGTRGEEATLRTIETSDLRDGLARAALAVGPRLSDRVVVWTQPFAQLPGPGGRAAGIAFATVAPLAFEPDDLLLELASPARARRPFAGRGFLASGALGLPARLRLTGPSLKQEVEGEVGGGRSLELEARPEVAGEAELELAATAGGHRVVRRARLEIGPPEIVLVLDPSGIAEAALAAQGVAVRSVNALPTELATTAAVVLGSSLSIEAQQRLVAAVEEGLGLFAFGAGLQREGEPLRDVFPVRLASAGPAGSGNQPDPAKPTAEPTPEPRPRPEDAPPVDEPRIDPAGPLEVDKHVLAMVLVVDRSGSMGTRVLGGGTKMSYAKTSARQTAAALADGDQVGVVTFGDDEQARIELPLTSATDRATVERGIEKLAHANERTYLDHGLVTATQLLKPSTAAVRHVVVLTDGEVWDQEVVLRRRAHEMRLLGITLSIVSIVDDRTQANFQAMADRVAREGGGKFLPVRDVRSVPQLVGAELERALDRIGRKPRGNGDTVDPTKPPQPPKDKPKDPDPPDPTPEESKPEHELEVRPVSRSPLLRPDPSEWPRLRACSAVAARRGVHVLLVVGVDGLPVLAFHNVAMGRVGTFAADLAGPDAEAFRREAGFPARLSQWVSSTRRAESTPVVPATIARSIEPPAPTPKEALAMRALAGHGPFSTSLLGVPPARTTTVPRSRVPAWALFATGLLVVLAALERWLVHRGA